MPSKSLAILATQPREHRFSGLHSQRNYPRQIPLSVLTACTASTTSSKFVAATSFGGMSVIPSDINKIQAKSYLARSLCRNVSGIFVAYFFGGFCRDFRGGFFWALLPTKIRGKNPASKSAEKSGGPKIKIREKSVLPKKTDPKIIPGSYFS